MLIGLGGYMADVFSKKKRSEVMSHIHSKNTLIERIVFRFLRKNNVYFQRHYGRVSGKPDIALPRKKKAVFIDGDFWHGRDYSIRKNKLPKYWVLKISANQKRDRKTRCLLKQNGWRILRVWEADLERKGERTLNKILRFLTE